MTGQLKAQVVDGSCHPQPTLSGVAIHLRTSSVGNHMHEGLGHFCEALFISTNKQVGRDTKQHNKT